MKKQRSAEEMAQVIREYIQSGESVREFCSRTGIAEHLLRYWMKRMERGVRDIPAQAVEGFSELKISKGATGFSLVLPHGLRLRRMRCSITQDGTLKTISSLLGLEKQLQNPKERAKS